MYEKNNTRKLVIAGVLLAIGIIVPTIFHTTGIPGNVFLPMHIPVLIGGFLLPPYLALILGMLTPILNSLITGMPKLFPMTVIMIFELGIYGLVTSILYRKLKMPSVISLIVSMISGRIMAGFVVFILAAFFEVKMDPMFFIIGGVTTAIPGIIIQLILVPSLVYSIVKYTTIDLD
ncbi:ECF transporter S component [Tissierella praeacuta]|uniref:ECF transporter S component n=1 Tax=Tissierella praeacuta TaxID=43131 RepID=UPI000EEF8380|nr:ECF transporter S component [Tissierella praeacuta]MBU5255062.1 ECF transporter S component [Tissierella praeacuta]HAE91967.1 ECF transporter S component [Tissierella sp.]